MALGTVAEYVANARVLLQDQVVPYRYPSADLIQGLNLSILEARRLRPDLFLESFDDDLPSFTAEDTTEVDIDFQFRPALLFYVVGYAQLRDDEDTTDKRASGFMARFVAELTSLV